LPSFSPSDLAASAAFFDDSIFAKSDCGLPLLTFPHQHTITIPHREIPERTNFIKCLLLYAFNFAVQGDMIVSEGETYF